MISVGHTAADYGESSQKRVAIHGEDRRPTWPSDSLPGDYSVTFGLYRMKPLSCDIFVTTGTPGRCDFGKRYLKFILPITMILAHHREASSGWSNILCVATPGRKGVRVLVTHAC